MNLKEISNAKYLIILKVNIPALTQHKSRDNVSDSNDLCSDLENLIKTAMERDREREREEGESEAD